MKAHKKTEGRRKFIRTAGCAALGSAGFFSGLFNLQAMSLASLPRSLGGSADEDYKALVCIMLRGGNDGFNMLVPFDDVLYQEYAAQRSNLAIPKEKLIPLSPVQYSEKNLAFHESMSPVKPLFDAGKLALVCNVGTLVHPINKDQVDNLNLLPTGLFSHSDQAHHWQTSIPQSSADTGWGGRLADIVYEANSNQQISMNISLSGKNIFQLGRQTSEYSILPTGSGSVGITGYGNQGLFDQLRTGLVDSLMEQQYQNIFKQSYADIVRGSQNAHELFSGAIEQTNLESEFSDSDMSQRLKMVARTIQVREQLGMKRQTFYIQMDGWDHHDDLLELQSPMLEELCTALSEFQNALEVMEIDQAVTTFCASDFGRALTSNGDGSDHAWGSNMLVMGSQVNGGDIYGNYPDLNPGSAQYIDGGIILPNLSTDAYYAELALWFGVSPTELPYVLPNIGRFYNVLSGQPPIGFMQQQ